MEQPESRGEGRSALYAVLGAIVAAVVLGAVVLALTMLRPPSPPPPIEAAAPAKPAFPTPAAESASPGDAPPTVAAETPAVEETAAPVAEPAVVEEVTIVRSTSPQVPTAPAVLPSSAARPTPARPGRPLPGPTPEAPRAQQVASLLSEADRALASQSPETAGTLYDAVLRLDPGNAAATAGKARVQARLSLARRSFLPGRTVVQTEKAGKLAGFETEDVQVQKSPDFLGRIEFEVSPSRVAPGAAYTVNVYVVNDGRKPIKVRSVTLGTTVNGVRSQKPLSDLREIAPQQRARVGGVSGEWREATTAWALDAQVIANKGDSLKNQLTWR